MSHKKVGAAAEVGAISLNGRTSLIDLVLTSSPSQILNCSTIPPLSNSDHRGIHLTISCRPHCPHQPSQHKRTVWRYMHADFEKACEMISETDWDALASTSTAPFGKIHFYLY